MCLYPQTGYYGREITKLGKRPIVFKVDLAFSGVPIRLPCGQCIECRLEHSRQWAMRCVHESQLHEVNSFVTLTYDDEHLPEHGALSRRDTQLFLKRLRKKMGRFRVFGCAEYGDRTNRPHYHMILFGLHFKDRKFYKKTRAGFDLYTSAILEDCWQMGSCQIGDVTFESAAYCARYVTKKVTGILADEHYTKFCPDTGELVRMTPEFMIASRRPGIAAGWFHKFGLQSYKFDAVVMRGMEMPPPKFYDALYEAIDSAHLARVKKARRRKAAKSLSERSPERRRVRETVTKAKLALKGRDL